MSFFFLSAYVSLWFLVFAGFACNYMIRINLNIAIVDMTAVKSKGQTILMCGDPAANASGDGVKKDFYTKKKVWREKRSIHRKYNFSLCEHEFRARCVKCWAPTNVGSKCLFQEDNVTKNRTARRIPTGRRIMSGYKMNMEERRVFLINLTRLYRRQIFSNKDGFYL